MKIEELIVKYLVEGATLSPEEKDILTKDHYNEMIFALGKDNKWYVIEPSHSSVSISKGFKNWKDIPGSLDDDPNPPPNPAPNKKNDEFIKMKDLKLKGFKGLWYSKYHS